MDSEIYIRTPESKNKKRAIVAINTILVIVIVLLLIVLCSINTIWSPFTIKGASMQETLHEGDKIVIIEKWYELTYGNIIVFEKDNEKKVIKRIIGMPNDVIRFDNLTYTWYRNDVALDEPYVTCAYNNNYLTSLTSSVFTELTTTGLTVKENELFVLGDNRIESNDSHIYGCISQDAIIGKYLFTY